MANQQIIDYIKQALAQGHSQEKIRETLLGEGWLAGEIKSAFTAVEQTAPQSPEKTQDDLSLLRTEFPVQKQYKSAGAYSGKGKSAGLLGFFKRAFKILFSGRPAFIGFAVIPLLLTVFVFSAIKFDFFYLFRNDASLPESRFILKRNEERLREQKRIETALEKYRDSRGQYPESIAELAPDFIFLNNIVKDPKTDQFYEYRLTAEGKNFQLCVNLEKEGGAEEKNCIGGAYGAVPIN